MFLALVLACSRPVGPFQPGPWVDDTGEPIYDALVWSDEFDGEAGTAPDASKWTYDVGGDGWGNDQLEFDTDRTENTRLSGDGILQIVALREEFGGRSYTSARIKTQGLFEFETGRIEARIKVPAGNGLWPAFWMLGADFEQVGWPNCGEIDIMEARGSQPQVIHGTVHGPGYSGGSGQGASFFGPAFTDEFHVFGLNKSPGRLSWDVDGETFFTLEPGDLPPEAEYWAFDKPFFLILNLAIGGNFLEQPDDSTSFPAMVEVDYIRVYGGE
ncbi:MAG: beta-glucanase (GH16 family) [Myxococcota bacterium]